MRGRARDSAPADRATPVEVFFDIVFVFTLTQLSHLLEEELSWANIAKILLIFAMLWWMYGGYVWLTNHVPPRRPAQKILLLVGMLGFLMANIAMPHAFDETGLLFGISFLVINAVHILMFMQSDAVRGVTRIIPFNFASAALVITAAFLHGPIVYGLWVAAFFVQSIMPYLVPKWSWLSQAGAFHVVAEHFVERHGLLVVVALGESVIALGMAVDSRHVTILSAAMAILTLVLPVSIWWTYFTDSRTSEKALEESEPDRRSQLALAAFFFAHIPILLGIIISAAGIHATIAHPEIRGDLPAAIALAGGVALFLLGMAAFRKTLSIPSSATRAIAAALIAGTIPLAMLRAGYQMLGIVLIMLAMLFLDYRARGYTSH